MSAKRKCDGRAHSAHRAAGTAPRAGAAGRCAELIGGPGGTRRGTRGVGDCPRALARQIVETSPASNTPKTYPSFGPTRGADSFKSTVVSRAGAGGALRSSRDAPTRRLCSRQCVWELARRVRIESERSFESMLTTARPNRIGTGVSDRSRAQAAPGAPLSRTGDSFSSFWMLAGALDRLA
jgi:hypothetical protein